MLFVPITVGGALAVAVALNRRIRGIRFYRLAVFIPVVTSTVATGDHLPLAARPDLRPRQLVLHGLGLPQQQFLQDPNQALYCVVAMTVWGWVGFDVIIYLAALQGIPQDSRGGGDRRRQQVEPFRIVRCRCSGPATLFLVVWSTINALQLFDEIYVTTRGGPLHSTTVVVYYLYQQAFQFFDAGYAAAIAYVLFVGDPGGHRDAALGRQPARLLQLMTAEPIVTIERPFRLEAPPASGRGGSRSAPGTSSCCRRAADAAAAHLDGGRLARDAGRGAALPAGAVPVRVQAGTTTRRAWHAAPFGALAAEQPRSTRSPRVASNLLFCSLAAYAFARMRFFGSNVLFVLILATLMVPFQVVLIPTFLIVQAPRPGRQRRRA